MEVPNIVRMLWSLTASAPRLLAALRVDVRLPKVLGTSASG